ncbi:hypothetical protein [Stenotrophomonas maltophilia]|uniref:hypothetical protein n=1 Tax=Stenotrophomonas maltophilia TaxID=40324 RepID=UPI0013DCE2D5|nr:hypothetical protein [Stenotrophomonas maltophilia]
MAVPNIVAPIWKPRAEYPVKATLTSRFCAELDAITKNKGGATSRIFTVVVLYPDNNNAVDPNAVLVMSRQAPPRPLGYLPSVIAAQHRIRMKEAGYSHLVSACEATTSGGLVTADTTYDCMLEVDLDMSADPDPEHLVIHPELVRLSADPEFKKDASGAYCFQCWFPHDALAGEGPLSRRIERRA